MNKKKMMNQLNSENGITAADAMIALLIIITTLGVIAMIYTNLVIGGRDIDRKTGATRIATNLLENIKMTYYDEIETKLKTLSDTGSITYQNETYTINGSQESTSVFNTTIPSGYTAYITLQNPENASYDLVKKVTVEVKYKVNNQEQSVILNQVIERERIRECNSPQFTDEYIQQMISTDEYIMYSETAKDASGVKVVCPIQYDHSSKSYKIITDTSSLWYSYSNKQWAHVLILNPSQVEEPIIEDMLKGENSYVWIPRFGVQNGSNRKGLF